MFELPARTALAAAATFATVVVSLGTGPADAQIGPTIESVLARVEARIAEFYDRAQSIVCIERSVVQSIGLDYNRADVTARTVESELRLEVEGGLGAPPRIVRRTLRVNGREPRERDKKDRAGCTDPEPSSIESLTFLLPDQRAEYNFRLASSPDEVQGETFTIDFASSDRRSRPELFADDVHDDCFGWSGHVAISGRIWIDADTHDVVRIERHLNGPVDIKVPVKIQRSHQLEATVVLRREDITTRYKRVSFRDPDDQLLLPESIHSVTMIQGGLQSTRQSQTFSNYQRFVTGGRIVGFGEK